MISGCSRRVLNTISLNESNEENEEEKKTLRLMSEYENRKKKF